MENLAGLREPSSAHRVKAIVSHLSKPDKTIFVTLRQLMKNGYVKKNEDGQWTITPKGSKALRILRKLRKLGEESVH
jgi:Mn-dependent DtxR family transcriptional regulator